MQKKGLIDIEKDIENFWNTHNVIDKFKNLNKDSVQHFYFCQGPPFTSGEAHIGHAWNHIIKDAIIRYKTSQGYNVFKRAGWDMHGLPIEVKVEGKFGIKTKKDIEIFGTDKFIEECKNFAITNMQAMTSQLKELTVWLDWENSYRTIDKHYMEGVWFGIKRAYEKNLLYEKEKVIHWCPRCETAMAGYEVADGYKEVTDTAIYVRTKLKNNAQYNNQYNNKFKNTYVVIWTTTPWTLPANVAIAVNPEIDYCIVEYENEIGVTERVICSRNSIKRIFGGQKSKGNDMKDIKKKKYKDDVLGVNAKNKEVKTESIENSEENSKDESKNENLNNLNINIIEIFKGKELENLQYEPILNIPAQNKVEHKIVMAKELVCEEDGSGCVHIAPGHGEEDASVGEKYHLYSLSPVDESGKFTIEPYKGIYIKDANKIIINTLKETGKLLKKENVTHTYPHCWRCHTPLLLRKTKQWFIAISKIRDELLRNNEKVNWIPNFIGHGGTSRFENWIKEPTDWCISRQRYWNTPLPVWKCEKCNNIDVIGTISELAEKGYIVEEGNLRNLKKLNSEEEISDLHKNFVDNVVIKCEKCGSYMNRVKDVMDVWLDSGSASWANLGYPADKSKMSLFPPDFITEGSDQTRGWFYSLLVMGTIAFDSVAYKNVLYHGFTLDEKGKKMSKSLGNVINPKDVVAQFGVDVMRMYVLSITPWDDLKFSMEEVKNTDKLMNMLLNVVAFIKTYGGLDNYVYDKYRSSKEYFAQIKNDLQIEDRMLISLINSLVKNTKENFNKFNIHTSVNETEKFINILSRYYLKLIRHRVWMEKESKEKETAYFTLFYTMDKFCKILSPLAPHIAEYIYKTLFTPTTEESVHLYLFPEYDESLIDEKLNTKLELCNDIVNCVLSAREEAKIKLRWPIREINVNIQNDKTSDLHEVEQAILTLANANKISYEKINTTMKIKPNYASIGKKFREKTADVVNIIGKISDEEYKIINRHGRIKINGIEITQEDIKTETLLPEGIVGEKFDGGIVYISTEIDEELFGIGIAREVIRRIQTMRKDLDLEELNVVECVIEGDDEFSTIINDSKALIEHETRTKINLVPLHSEKISEIYYVKDWEIEDFEVRIGIKRIKK
ncbi:Isoleucine--tRNA ligase [groundwater metagenome]|uniref:isoleucine--tRNA ligase n=1 Tax=groundwater metagenome TaxID=717931 RepID=A0A098E9Q1_9ZZZZ